MSEYDCQVGDNRPRNAPVIEEEVLKFFDDVRLCGEWIGASPAKVQVALTDICAQLGIRGTAAPIKCKPKVNPLRQRLWDAMKEFEYLTGRKPAEAPKEWQRWDELRLRKIK